MNSLERNKMQNALKEIKWNFLKIFLQIAHLPKLLLDFPPLLKEDEGRCRKILVQL